MSRAVCMGPSIRAEHHPAGHALTTGIPRARGAPVAARSWARRSRPPGVAGLRRPALTVSERTAGAGPCCYIVTLVTWTHEGNHPYPDRRAPGEPAAEGAEGAGDGAQPVARRS